MAALLFDLVLINIYYMLWIGLAAMAVGVLLIWLPELSVPLQITTFGVLSAALLIFWIYFLRDVITRISFDSEEIIGARGVVTKWNNGRGKIRLQRPFCGTDVWRASSPERIKVGDHAVICDVQERIAILRTNGK